MDDRADDRLRGGLLVAAALLAVTAGGWWWWAEAPATGPRGVAVGTSPPLRGVVPSRSPRTLDEVLAANPGTTARVHIDAETGRVIEATELPGEDGEVGLPRFTDTLWRERLTLIPGQEPVRRQSLADGARHLLQYRCAGAGELQVSIDYGSSTDTARTTCDGGLGAFDLPDRTAPIRIELSAVGPGPVAVAAQLVALP
ncbi:MULTISPECIES: hypothetical protein [unclassified Micromonospora]|uniref:hypothetical protein n=1 Tax=unclassified Micromonospora TaxID=2617518 RepID=UPI002FF1F313